MAKSRTASTCSRRTPGNHSRKSATVAPSSRFSKSALTGTRVPRNTHKPLIRSGEQDTSAQFDQSSIWQNYFFKAYQSTTAHSHETPPRPGASARVPSAFILHHSDFTLRSSHAAGRPLHHPPSSISHQVSSASSAGARWRGWKRSGNEKAGTLTCGNAEMNIFGASRSAVASLRRDKPPHPALSLSPLVTCNSPLLFAAARTSSARAAK